MNFRFNSKNVKLIIKFQNKSTRRNKPIVQLESFFAAQIRSLKDEIYLQNNEKYLWSFRILSDARRD